jgi:hypothetical protein
MIRNALAATAMALAAAGCSNAEAGTADPANDVHCFALAMGFRINADLQKVPGAQRHAAAVIEAWYGRSFDRFVGEQGEDRAQSEVAPIVAAFDADPGRLKGAYAACAERATADPAFDSFARRAARR